MAKKIIDKKEAFHERFFCLSTTLLAKKLNNLAQEKKIIFFLNTNESFLVYITVKKFTRL